MQPVPTSPINVQRTNPYNGKDRGLFLVHTPADQYARIHAARWRCTGPNAALGRLEFQIMVFQAMPVSDADFMNGTLLTAPGGGTWFDCLTREPVLVPIIAEYWGKHSYKTWYANPDVTPARLTPEEISRVDDQNAQFVTTMGSYAGLKTVELIATFNVTSGQPLTRSSLTLNFTYGDNQSATIADWPKDPVDPVQTALAYIRAQKDIPPA